jgi:hypothetical protein
MDKPARAKMIVDYILSLNEQFGRAVPPQSFNSTSKARLISDGAWHARWTMDHDDNSSGDPWDLFELFVHGQPALTAVLRGDEVVPQFYIPGQWERMFIDIDIFDTVPLFPN